MIPDIRITIYGMYENDSSIFDKLELPIELENEMVFELLNLSNREDTFTTKLLIVININY